MPFKSVNSGQTKVFTSPLAIITIADKPVGKMMNLSFTENLTRVDGRELGSIYTYERPIVGVSCTFTAQMAVIYFDKLGSVPNAFWPNDITSPIKFANQLLFGECEADISVYSKAPIKEGGQEKGNATEGDWLLLGTISSAMIDSRTFNLTNDQIVTQNINGSYLRPMNIGIVVTNREVVELAKSDFNPLAEK